MKGSTIFAFVFIVGLLFTIAISLPLFVAVYVPNKNFNDNAVLATCQRSGNILSGRCNVGNLQNVLCYSVVISMTVTIPEAGCRTPSRPEIFFQEYEAQAYLRSNTYTFPCYAQFQNLCNWSDQLKDTVGPLAAGITFLAVGGLILLGCIIFLIYYFHKRLQALVY